jgi:hypothetical protein
VLNRYRDVFKCLHAHEVRYLVIGGIAAIIHGVPRMTLDLDMLIDATQENAQRLVDAFLDAGLGTAALTTAEGILAIPITVFADRVRIDVQTKTPGIAFADAWPRRQTIEHEGQEIHVVSRQDLIASKLAAGRPVDLEDVRLLRLADEAPPDKGGA